MLRLLTGVAALALLTGSALAQTNWTGTVSDDWFTPGNWSNSVPAGAANAIIDTDEFNSPVIDNDDAATTGNITIGHFGVGDLTIQNGGALSNSVGYIGINAGSDGTVLVTGDGSTWTNNGTLSVGERGAGTLMIEDGGAVSSTTAVIGWWAGSTGKATVTGANSTWTNNDLFVAYEGTGTLSIEDGAKVSNSTGYIGGLAIGTGEVTVSGTGSTWTNFGALFVGERGSGRLKIEDGGTVTATAGTIARYGNSSGSAEVTGMGSIWDISGDLYVGQEGSGTLTIDNGGTVTNTTGHVGNASGSNGTATVSGENSTWTNSGSLVVGDSGTGTLSIEDGGTVTNTFGYVGYSSGSTGTVTVTGENSTWTNSGSLVVGYNGTGTLTIEEGGTVTDTNGFVGTFSGSIGTVTVSGENSTWTNSGSLAVGDSGTGTLSIEDGGTVTNAFGLVGYSSGSTGTVTVTGENSTWTNSSVLFVGREGTGTLTITEGGTVTNAFGGVGLDATGIGTVTVTGENSTWTTNDYLYVGVFGTATLTISDGGLVRTQGGAETVVMGMFGASTGTLNIGAAASDPAVAPGTLEAAAIAFGSGNSTINFNHTGTAYTFAPAISGAGNINVLSGTTILPGNSSGFWGDISVTGGTLAVNGILGGTLDVSGTGILAGTGTVGTTVVASGGTISPGNSIGTLTVDGDLTFETGSTYRVEVDPQYTDVADLIHVTGTATLAGTVSHVGLADTYQPRSTYTILTADGGLTGTFDGAISTYTFLDPDLDYDINNVFLTLERNNIEFASVAETPNQSATAGGLEGLGFGNPLWEGIVLLSPADARNAFDQLSGEMHASGKTALINNSSRLRTIINNRINSAFGERSSTETLPLMGYGPSKGLVDLPPANRYGAWGHVYGSWGATSATTNTAALRQDDGGFLVGADGRFGDVWHGGVFGGYSRSSFSAPDRSSSGTGNNYHLGIYGGAELGAVQLNAGAAHSWHSIDTVRNVAFPGFTDMLTASYGARTMQVFGEASYRMDAGAARFEPFAGLAHVNLHTNGFTEAGGAAALTSAASSTSTTFSTLGIRASTVFQMGDMKATARTMIGWRHPFGDTTPTSSFAFAGSNSFAISGAPITRNVAVVELGLDVGIGGNATLGVSYDGQFGKGSRAHSANARLGVRF